jgi:hypothetical protein
VSRAALVLALLVLAPGAGAAAAPTGTEGGGGTATDAPPRADPPTDRLGWEGGYWYDDPVPVDRSDGLSRAEVAALAARGMARVERIRGLEFRDPPAVEVVSRADLGGNRTVSRARRLRRNVRAEALFLVGESTDVTAGGGGMGIGAFYAPWDDRIVLVSTDDGTARTHELVLAHELTHALQAEHADADRRWLEDRRRAAGAASEGEANYVTQAYRERCGEAWDCLLPARDRRTVPLRCDPDARFDRARHLLSLFPYSDGPPLIARTRAAEGWSGVARLVADPPESTEQVIHPDRADEPPRPPPFVDRSRANWTVVEPEWGGRPAPMRLGEAALFAMLWGAWFDSGGAGAVIPCEAAATDAPRDLRSYAHPITTGWAGDRLVPYAPPNATDPARTGYVWRLAWDRPRDACEFAAGYRGLLSLRGAAAVGPGVYRLPADAGGDVIALRRSGRTVTVANGPSRGALDAIRPGLAAAGPAPAPPAARATPPDDLGALSCAEDARPVVRGRTGPLGRATAGLSDAVSGRVGPGGWVALAVLALAVGVALALARRRRGR